MKWYKVEFELGDYKYDNYSIRVNYTNKKEILKELKSKLGEGLIFNYKLKNIKIREEKWRNILSLRK